MPTEEQDLERLREALSSAKMQPEREASYEDMALFYMRETVKALQQGKPKDRGELARRYAIVITEMEKVFAYFKTFIIDAFDNTDN